MTTSTAEDLSQNEEDEQNTEEVSPLNLSDDDFNNLNFEDLDDSAEEDSDDDVTNTTETNDEDKDNDGIQHRSDEDGTDDGAGESGVDEGTDGSGDDESGSIGDGKSGDTSGDEESGGSDGGDEGDSTTSESDSDDSKTESKSVSEAESLNFEDEYKKLLAPFRANNKDMHVESVEDARTLMQMGANYNKKMAGLKPNLKLIKMLQNNDLLDEGKLNFLIDLDKKDPEAIKKFLQDSGVNPLEIDLESDNEYKSNTYTVNDKEVELDGILEDIKDTESFSETIDIISNKWDESSKQILLDQPNVIKTINEHVKSGVYAKIAQAVEHKRMMGALLGVSDLEAYQTVGNEINDAGGFDSINTTNNDVNTSTNTSTETKPAKKSVDPKLRDRKKAASSTKTNIGAKGQQEFNPLSMSDEDFEKAGIEKFL